MWVNLDRIGLSGLPPVATGQQTSRIGSFVPNSVPAPSNEHVRIAPDSDRTADIPERQVRASSSRYSRCFIKLSLTRLTEH